MQSMHACESLWKERELHIFKLLYEIVSIALSTDEAENIATCSCAQVLYLKQQFGDFKLIYNYILIKCNNINAVNLSENPILHSSTKYIEIRYQFMRYHV